ncbi:hypothetical protein [Pseudoalteromonas denitrificans]|uniref:Uncharacterized protein n=1 Tax=Pseudoalteromonas denitrificans DSM 6059 TaxID=1123010 RepID=A0A1I1Q8Q5_9GAMM|nr:hypothetical protein [Pseudoalteromonas denitrificans]SFD18491.1 hypothetical protein SAMN02745724_03789 [Pseudoalteromonas denitrificans DSM 6059]
MSLEKKTLSKDDLISLNRLGENLKKVIHSLVSQFPQSAQSISGMSQWLDFNRSNCQRILNALQKSRNGKDVLCLLPGISGLDEFVIKVKETDISIILIDEMQKIIQVFNLQIKQYAKSHAHLKRLLQDTIEKKDSAEAILTAEEKRKQHYLCSKQLLASSINTLFSCYVLTESANNKEYLQEVAMITKCGISRSKESPPLVQFYTHPHPEGFISPEHITSESRIETSQFHIGIVDEFSDSELAKAYSSYSASNSGIVFNDLPNNEPFDASFLFSNPDELANPLVHESKCSSTSISIKTPTEKLVMMVFLDKKLDMRSTVNVGCYANNQKVEEGKLKAADMWTERLPEFPELNVLHVSSERARNIAALNVGEMSDYLFNFANLNKDDFVCYMMEINYPIWSSTYRIYFEHC